MTFEKQLLAKIRGVPAGDKLPLSRIARELNCSVGVVMVGVETLLSSGALDKATLRPPLAEIPLQATPSAATAPKLASALLGELEAFLASSKMAPTRFGKASGLGLSFVANLRAAKSNPRPATVERVRAFIAAWQPPPPKAARDDRPSGADLVDRLGRAAKRRGVSITAFVRPLSADPSVWLDQLGIARRPTARTIERVDALIAGRPIPAGKVPASAAAFTGTREQRAAAGLAPSERTHRDARAAMRHAARRGEEEARRQAAETAALTRLPGETIAAAVAREAAEAGDRRTVARESKGVREVESVKQRLLRLSAEVDGELNCEAALEAERQRERELDELVSPSAVLRRAQRDWPEQCAAVKAIAAELGVTLGEAWRRVIGAGVECMSECDDEGAGGAIQRMAGA